MQKPRKLIPLLGRALWWFRWGALVTDGTSLGYYAMFILKADVNNANTIGGGHSIWDSL
jgi:hypothetical protein